MDLPVSPAVARRSHHNLPADLTRFIGREPEIAEVKRLLSSSRLFTLAGSDGVGKTRLALKVAAVYLAREDRKYVVIAARSGHDERRTQLRT